MVDSSTLKLPGRLGTPDMVLRDDPRADPRMIAVLEVLGIAGAPEPATVSVDSTLEEIREHIAVVEDGMAEMSALLVADLPPIGDVTMSVEVIRGVDDNDITLFVHRPTDKSGPLPGILHIHGGGMIFSEAANPGYRRLRDELAATGMVVVGVEFRNGAGKQGPYPFPAGLNDCTSALQWINENKQGLGIGKLIVSGESGGGNLTLATTLKAKRDGRLDQIDGVYALCPYISNAYAERDPRLVSLHETDGYFLGVEGMAPGAKAYDPTGANATNPLAWPYHATERDLAGLPPHVISVNELDPLRDEGLAYFRNLLAAGVGATSRTVNGTCHAGDILFRAAMPEVSLATLHDIKSFADSL
jgi:acetyl esterase/lipase